MTLYTENAMKFKTTIVNIIILSQLIYNFIAILIKIPALFFAEIDMLILKLIWKCKGSTIAQSQKTLENSQFLISKLTTRLQ